MSGRHTAPFHKRFEFSQVQVREVGTHRLHYSLKGLEGSNYRLLQAPYSNGLDSMVEVRLRDVICQGLVKLRLVSDDGLTRKV